ncbi:hypothetical protein N9O95_03465 [Alphaproteobacteria bacterium]|nr:hypothetical protein [Alphaproteobacteria bacterium]
MMLFIINIYQNSRESIDNIENILKQGYCIFVFVDGSNEDFLFINEKRYPEDRLKIFCAPQNVGLLWARVSAWRLAKKYFDIEKFSYVNFVDGGEDKVVVENVWDFNEWTTDLVETNCQFRTEANPKYDGKRHAQVDRLTPAQGFLAGKMINNVWNKYVRPDVLDRALTKLEQLRLNFAEDIVFVGLVCLESRSWRFLNRIAYIYDNTGSSLSRPSKPEGWLGNTSELKKAFALVSSYYPKSRFEVTLLLWLMYMRNNTGMKHKHYKKITQTLSGTPKSDNLFDLIKIFFLRKAYVIVKYGLTFVLVLRDR